MSGGGGNLNAAQLVALECTDLTAHHEAVQGMGPTVDNAEPPTLRLAHLQFNAKKQAMDEWNQAVLAKLDTVRYNRMVNMMSSLTLTAKDSAEAARTRVVPSALTSPRHKQRHEEVMTENHKISHALSTTRSAYAGAESRPWAHGEGKRFCSKLSEYKQRRKNMVRMCQQKKRPRPQQPASGASSNPNNNINISINNNHDGSSSSSAMYRRHGRRLVATGPNPNVIPPDEAVSTLRSRPHTDSKPSKPQWVPAGTLRARTSAVKGRARGGASSGGAVVAGAGAGAGVGQVPSSPVNVRSGTTTRTQQHVSGSTTTVSSATHRMALPEEASEDASADADDDSGYDSDRTNLRATQPQPPKPFSLRSPIKNPYDREIAAAAPSTGRRPAHQHQSQPQHVVTRAGVCSFDILPADERAATVAQAGAQSSSVEGFPLAPSSSIDMNSPSSRGHTLLQFSAGRKPVPPASKASFPHRKPNIRPHKNASKTTNTKKTRHPQPQGKLPARMQRHRRRGSPSALQSAGEYSPHAPSTEAVRLRNAYAAAYESARQASQGLSTSSMDDDQASYGELLQGSVDPNSLSEELSTSKQSAITPQQLAARLFGGSKPRVPPPPHLAQGPEVEDPPSAGEQEAHAQHTQMQRELTQSSLHHQKQEVLEAQRQDQVAPQQVPFIPLTLRFGRKVYVADGGPRRVLITVRARVMKADVADIIHTRVAQTVEETQRRRKNLRGGKKKRGHGTTSPRGPLKPVHVDEARVERKEDKASDAARLSKLPVRVDLFISAVDALTGARVGADERLTVRSTFATRDLPPMRILQPSVSGMSVGDAAMHAASNGSLTASTAAATTTDKNTEAGRQLLEQDPHAFQDRIRQMAVASGVYQDVFATVCAVLRQRSTRLLEDEVVWEKV